MSSRVRTLGTMLLPSLTRKRDDQHLHVSGQMLLREWPQQKRLKLLQTNPVTCSNFTLRTPYRSLRIVKVRSHFRYTPCHFSGTALRYSSTRSSPRHIRIIYQISRTPRHVWV